MAESEAGRRPRPASPGGDGTAPRRRTPRLRLDLGMLLSAVSGILLLLMMFQGWFGLESAAPVADDAVGVGLGRSFNAWVSFAWIDLYLLAAVVFAVTLVVLAVLKVGFPVKPGPALLVVGGLAFLLILFRIVVPPWDGADREAAPYLALLFAAGIAAGGQVSNLLLARLERVSRSRNGAGRPDRAATDSLRPGRRVEEGR